MPQQRSPAGSASFSAPQPTPSQGVPNAGEDATMTWQDGGYKNPGGGGGGGGQPGNFHRQERTIQEGNSTTHVTTDTSTENIGGNTVTRTRREITTTIGGGGDSPADRPSMFNVAANTGGAGPKPGVWAPSGGGAGRGGGPGRGGGGGAGRGRGMTVKAPRGINVMQNTDRSVTMSLGFGGDAKENVSPHRSPPRQRQAPHHSPARPMHPAPQHSPVRPKLAASSSPMFSVKKVSTNQPSSGAWNPGNVPTAPKKFAPEPEPVPMHQPSWETPQQNAWSPKASEPMQQQDSVLAAPIWAAKIEVEEDRSFRHQNIPPASG